ncbi:MAG TPA: NAD-dependent epimerase/dehydratase family protein [Polyangiaceae bacterium LLY-WYZ-15_(1-7)]|nr:epimerase [Sandaracinus sp.]HJK94752.1 NAD-dependent epimerase/dehydratase family protein [Polyangiaceae bacterium LLY-WYZ-15_(1-7)]MBJ70892.1 epimerase [Sandaracinus sp.]HJL01413.1 NAD-dependent epimerase/dehydratase family protein [Polyangiaceae bacterium LLY-WYZ-15_(1-7)]HJL08568.1 NAD-dependent epimerase/dehydratase family protein [Polyangiaceae bacterium LLY-WYZ-15_(1-7)]
MIEGKTFCITGGAGFIGTALIRRIADHNRVRVLDILRRNALGAAGLDAHPNVELIEGDVRDRAAVDAAVAGADYVVHMASIAGVDTVLKNPVPTMEISLEGTMNVLRAAKDAGGVERLVDFSTSEVFGSYAFRVREADVTSLGAVGEARWTYAVSKLATEHLAHNYYKEHGLPTCAIRPFNIYGPGQVGEGAVHAFVLRALRGEPITIHNEGDQIRSWCFIDDIVEGLLLALTREEAVGETFNIGNPRSTVTIYQLARLIRRLAGSESELRFVDWDFADVELRIPDVKKAERLLGFRAQVDLEDGLERTIAWYRQKLAE